MLKVAIIADDLTGANDTGAVLAQDGFGVATLTSDKSASELSGYDVVCVSADSRAMSPEKAASAITQKASLFEHGSETLFSKRVDSTLRGNVGAEIDAILDWLGEDYTAVVVAAFPSSGRCCIGDVLMVNNVPLQLTEVARDPLNPMRDSRVTHIVAQQSRHEVGYIGLERVTGFTTDLINSISEAADEYRVVVIDAQTDHDIDAIANCCVATGKKIVAIDPGPFTARLADCIFKHRYETRQSVLCAIGSASELTQRQIAYLRKHDFPGMVKLDSSALFDRRTRANEIDRVVSEVERAAKSYRLLVVDTVESKDDLVDFSKIAAAQLDRRERSRTITAGLSEVTVRVLEELGDEIGALYASGGDVSAAIFDRMGIDGFEVKAEVIPLAIYSRLLGGVRPGLPVVTKGGLIGTEETLYDCVDYLRGVIH